jgi:hypothetical protein
MSYEPKGDLQVIELLPPERISPFPASSPHLPSVLDAIHALDAGSDQVIAAARALPSDSELRVQLERGRVEIQQLCIRLANAARKEFRR